MNKNKKAAAPLNVGSAAKLSIKPVQLSDNSTAAQCVRLFDGFSRGPLTTIDIRKQLDIIHPAGRVFTLRQRGYDIKLTRVWRPTDTGALHRVGLYTLMPRRRGGRHAR